MERMEQVSHAMKVETKLRREALCLLFGAESPSFPSLLIDMLLFPLVMEGARLEDRLELAAVPLFA